MGYRSGCCRSLSRSFLIAFLIPLFGCSDESPDSIPAPVLMKSYAILRSSPYFATPCWGTKGYPSSETVAFRRILASSKADAHFKDLLHADRVAARLYGLAGLFFTDSTFFATVIPPYVENSDTVQVFSGGELIPVEIGEIAKSIQTGELPRELRDDACLTLLSEGFGSLYHPCVCTRTAVNIMMGMDEPTSPNSYVDRNLFEDQVFTASTELGLIRSVAQDDPDFSSVTRLLTNNKADVVWLRIRDVPGESGGGTGSDERRVFNLTTTDFAGKNIARIDMIVNDLRFISPGELGGTDVFVTTIFRIWGPSRAH